MSEDSSTRDFLVGDWEMDILLWALVIFAFLFLFVSYFYIFVIIIIFIMSVMLF
jgi:hypothetical protein